MAIEFALLAPFAAGLCLFALELSGAAVMRERVALAAEAGADAARAGAQTMSDVEDAALAAFGFAGSERLTVTVQCAPDDGLRWIAVDAAYEGGSVLQPVARATRRTRLDGVGDLCAD
ncbi:MAG: hypothetical protein NW215_09185 [Hyphomicrobiales bacterium]|nr:hypothetical protein [Hyphomicrobiales bacterium]